MDSEVCLCAACYNLQAGCCPALFPLYARKLLIRGWAGLMTPAEKAYRMAHSIVAQHAALQAQRLSGYTFHNAQRRAFTRSADGLKDQTGV